MKKPETLQLKFCTIIKDDLTEGFGAALLEPETGITYFAGELKLVADWLDKKGYKWMPGTNGIWTLHGVSL